MQRDDFEKLMIFIALIVGFSIMTLSIWSGDIISDYFNLTGFGRYFIMYFTYWLVRTFIKTISEDVAVP